MIDKISDLFINEVSINSRLSKSRKRFRINFFRSSPTLIQESDNLLTREAALTYKIKRNPKDEVINFV